MDISKTVIVVLTIISFSLIISACKKDDCVPKLHSPNFKIVFLDSLSNQPKQLELDSFEIVSYDILALQHFNRTTNHYFENDTLIIEPFPQVYNYQLFYKDELIEDIIMVFNMTSILECDIYHEINSINTLESTVCQIEEEYLIKLIN